MCNIPCGVSDMRNCTEAILEPVHLAGPILRVFLYSVFFRYKMSVKDHGYIEPNVHLYEMDVYDKMPFIGSLHYVANKTVNEDKQVIFHNTVLFFGLLKSKLKLHF